MSIDLTIGPTSHAFQNREVPSSLHVDGRSLAREVLRAADPVAGARREHSPPADPELLGRGNGGSATILVGDDPRTRPIAHAALIKRIIDLVGATAALVLLSPVLLVIAVLIRLDSRGPILFRQERMGRGGRMFRIAKFRTMTTDAEDRLPELEARNESAGGVLFKIRHDPRVTRLGRLLRRTSLDELPQLLNVLRGEMSLVGPRPLQLRDCALLRQRDSAGYHKRLQVLPGITGLWQVSGRSDLGFARMLDLDARYIDSASLGMDLRIIVQTIKAVLKCNGSY
jgi:lipopolysaccharide/colanic/teichoic acid biosynthesis glycosyltransferase